MIISSNRVPGQLLPVGARWWGNAGAPINVAAPTAAPAPPAAATSGLGKLSKYEPKNMLRGLGVLGYNTPVTDFVIDAGMGYLVGLAISGQKGFSANQDAVIGALAGGFFGLFGVAVQSAVALGGVGKAKALHSKYKKKRAA